MRLKAAVSTPLAAVAGGIGEVEPDAGVKQRHQDQAERQRYQARENEPAERAHADAPERGDVAHVRDARDQRRENERRDDHLDEAQEQRGDDAEIVGDRLQPLGRRRRAVVDRIIDQPPRDDPEHQRDQDEPGQFLGHTQLSCLASLRGAQRRSNPECTSGGTGLLPPDFAGVAMTEGAVKLHTAWRPS